MGEQNHGIGKETNGRAWLWEGHFLSFSKTRRSRLLTHHEPPERCPVLKEQVWAAELTKTGVLAGIVLVYGRWGVCGGGLGRVG